jgi:hypothetical protein
VSAWLIKVGCLLVAASLITMLAAEVVGRTPDHLRDLSATGLAAGICMVMLGVVLAMLGRLTVKAMPSRCARCGRVVQRGQVYCADHLKLAVNEARDAYHSRSFQR